jgi:hypothetical protein
MRTSVPVREFRVTYSAGKLSNRCNMPTFQRHAGEQRKKEGLVALPGIEAGFQN